MAIVSGQLKDASIKGKPRDLMDEIFRISPTDTPFLTMCGFWCFSCFPRQAA